MYLMLGANLVRELISVNKSLTSGDIYFA